LVLARLGSLNGISHRSIAIEIKTLRH
jgi:hypothetical protein